MFIIGLTGGIATGKSTVAEMFKRLGATVIDADKVVHQLLSPKERCFKKVVQMFGEEILNQGRIDRKKLGAIVFSKPRLRKKLEAILHPEVRARIKEKIQRYCKTKRVKVLVLEIPLLFESHWHRQVDATVVVTSTKDQQIRRTMKNLKISRKEVLQRIQAQMPLREKVQLADYVVRNNQTKLKTKSRVSEIYREILKVVS